MTKMPRVGLAAFAAIFFAVTPSMAVEILHTHIDDQGNLDLDIGDEPPPVPLLNYHARARAVGTYVCANFSGQPYSVASTRTVESILSETAFLATGAGGSIRGRISLTLPRERVNLACPRGFSVQLASVVYSQMEVRNPFGHIAYARDDARVFIRLERPDDD